MSNTQKPASTETPAAEVPSTPVLVEKQPNVLVRGFRKIKSTPPKTAIAVAGGVALVTAGAVLGRRTAPYHVAVVEGDFQPEPILETPASESDTVD